MRLFGLIGYPLGHSFSASWFNEKFRKMELDARYENFPIESIGQFTELVHSHPRLAGLNVTIPYKEAIIPFLDGLSTVAEQVQAVNTLCFVVRARRRQVIGYNTDVIGFERSLKEHLGTVPEKALVLGTGGACKAVHHVLRRMGIAVTPVSRVSGAGKLGYHELDDAVIADHKLIVNTTPLGMAPAIDTAPDIPYGAVGKGHLLFDLVYNPRETKFLAFGKSRGAATVNGYDMLVYQAEASWELWNRNVDESEKP